MKQFFGKKSRSALAMVFIVSLGLHVVAIVIFGTIKFVAEVMREETVFEAAPIAPAPQEKQEYQVNIQQRSRSTPPPQPPTIVVNNPTDMSIPALDIDVNVDSSSVFGRAGGGFGGGIEGVRQMAITANLFGKTVQAGRLGVILDVSFSTHSVISFVVEEIQKGFPDALIVFTPGCAIDERDGELVPISDYEETSQKYPHMHNGKRAFATKPFIDALLKREDFQEIWKRADRQDNGFVVFAKLKSHDGNAASHTAMRYLADNGADVIYWFADFNDHVSPDGAQKIAGYLRRKGAKLMIHDFVPGLPKGGKLETLQMMADRTDGELFLKEFKK